MTATPAPRRAADPRRKLEALFGRSDAGGARASGARRPPRGSPSERWIRLERLRLARDPAEIAAATDAYLAAHQLPDDLDILLKVLQHPSEAVLREAMGQIASLLTQGRIASTVLLACRLDELAARVQEPSTWSFVDGLRAQMAQIAARSAGVSAGVAGAQAAGG